MTLPLREILLSQRFLPEIGGSINWMYEVYRRWDSPVQVITHDYHMNSTSDAAISPNFLVERHDILLLDWGLDTVHSIRRYFRMLRAVWKHVRRGEHTRIHCTHVVPEVVSLLPLLALSRTKISVISYAHGEELLAYKSSRQLLRLFKMASRRVDVLIANSTHTAKLILDLTAHPRVEVVQPGVDISHFAGAGEAGLAWRRKHNIADETVVLLTLARITLRKNHQGVMRALAALPTNLGNYFYVVAGPGATETLKEEASALALSDRVLCLGEVSDQERRALLGACDIFVMPSYETETDTEGFGIVFLEAAACKKVSIAGTAGGQAEAVLHGETGFVVDGKNHEAITKNLRKLISDSALRARLGAAAYQHAKKHDWCEVVRRTQAILKRNLAEELRRC